MTIHRDYFTTSNFFSYFSTIDLINNSLKPSNYQREIKTYQWHTKSIYEQEGIDYDADHSRFMNDFQNKLSHLDDYTKDDKSPKIPTITHQIYFAFNDNQNHIKNSSVTKTINTLSKLNTQASFKHYIWTNDPNIIPESIKDIEGVEVHLIQELKNTRLFSELNLYLNQALIGLDKGKLSMASDVLRSMVIREFGGIYRDFDYEIFNEELLYKYMLAFNFIGGTEFDTNYSFVGSAFFAATANHHIMNIEADIIERNINSPETSPEYTRFPYSKFEKAIYVAGPAAVTIAFYKGYDQQNNNDLLLPPKALFNFEYAWSLTPDSKCYSRLDKNNPPKLTHEYNGTSFKTVGGDMFCGDWPETKGYDEPIKYLSYNNDVEIVVARYNEDLEWLKAFKNYKVTVYNKGLDNLILPNNCQIINLENIGREAHSYLYHVITNYETLAQKTIFLQGDPFYHKPNFDYLINGSPHSCAHIIAECREYNLGFESNRVANVQWQNTKWNDTTLSKHSMLSFAQTNFNPEFDEDSSIYFQWGAQFAVDKENIICHDIDYHKKLYDHFLIKSPIEGHYIENLWDEWANCDNLNI